MKKILLALFSALLILLCVETINGQVQLNTEEGGNVNELIDNGKMWTFDYPPLDQWEATYGFRPTEEWLEDVRLSTLRFGRGCTASFVSGDGLIMTNHHCGEYTKERIALVGEDFSQKGFYAATLEEERKVPGLTVRQLVLIEDVTDQIRSAIAEGKTDEEKIDLKKKIVDEIENKYNDETGLSCDVVTFYNGGKYSLYGYKIYSDIRLVFIPDPQLGYFGGDFDNFTYPRYNLDCAFFRAYDEDENPVKSNNYFVFSEKVIKENELIFTSGNPGSTKRLKSVAQLEFLRDVTYRNGNHLYDGLFKEMEKLQKQYPDKFFDFEAVKANVGNGQKVYFGRMAGLNDESLMARKKAFEDKLKGKVNSDPVMKEKFGHVWESLANIQDELGKYEPWEAVYSQRGHFVPAYFTIADKLVKLAEELNLDKSDRSSEYTQESIEETINSIFPDEFDEVIEKAKVKLIADYFIMNLGSENELVQKMFEENTGYGAADFILSNSKLMDKDFVIEIAKEGSDTILNLDDPFLYYAKKKSVEFDNVKKKLEEIRATENIYEDMLGQVMFNIYGTEFPPDANMTFRLSDGVLKGFEYNGTIAPVKTTYYGMYDRYYGNDGEYPWNLPEVWQNPSDDFDMSAPFNYVTSHDIIGGNSGSAIINTNAEAVALAFDGNIMSNIGNVIYVPKENRCVSVSTKGMMEAFEHIYKLDRFVKELRAGKIVD